MLKEAGLCYTTYVCTHMRMTGTPVWISVSTMPTAPRPCLHLVPDLLSFHVHKTCLTAPAYHITESEQCVYKVICLAVKHHNHGPTAQTTTMQSLQYYKHLSEPMVECLHILLQSSTTHSWGMRSCIKSQRRASVHRIPKGLTLL